MKPRPAKPVAPAPDDVVDAIEKLHKVLTIAYGIDFAYSIVGRGHMLAASNARDGDVRPQRKGKG